MTLGEREDPPASPIVSVVIATRDRRELLLTALAAIRSQEYPGVVECVVVFDQTPVAHDLAVASSRRPVRTIANTDAPGLAGGRNCGIEAASGDLIGFCDDDDEWLPGKLARQVLALERDGADVVVCGIRIDYGDRTVDRVPHTHELTTRNLSANRVSAAHPSTLLARRAALATVGPVDEDIPGSYGEDYDWLLRASSAVQLTAVSEPLVRVLWAPTSYFAGRWEMIVSALDYLIAKHRSIRESRPGLARVLGQKAFALAAMGRRSRAIAVAREALRLNPREQRAYLAVLVACRVLSASWVVHQANSRGRGI